MTVTGDGDLFFLPVDVLARMVRDGECSAVELVEHALRRIETLEPQVNAFTHVAAEEALAAARAASPGDERPFAGVPIAIKGNVPVKGWPHHSASRLLADRVGPADAFLVTRLRDAGFIPVGQTNLPEFGILPTTEPRFSGPTRNPWDTTRTPGGSSGGSAAAVAAGMVPIAHGNDGGGSIRIPAACCGLVGLKPNRGRISRGAARATSFLTVEGVLTRTVADTARALDVLAGYEVGDATWVPRPGDSWVQSCTRSPGRLRIGVTPANTIDVPVHPESLGGLRAAADLLASLGHEISDYQSPPPPPETLGLFTTAFAASLAMDMAEGEALKGSPPSQEEIEPLSRAIYELASQTPARAYLSAVSQLEVLSRDVVASFAQYDLILTPALAQRPVAIGELDGCGEDGLGTLIRAGGFAPYSALFNVTGQPAITVPVGMGDDGLPVCVQLAGAPLAEDTLLQVAAQMEQANPWVDRRPALAQA